MRGMKNIFLGTLTLLLFLVPQITTASKDILINEVYYHTIGNDHEEEFIELYNSSQKPIELKDYQLKNNLGVYTLPSIKIPAQGFLTICRTDHGFENLFGFKPDLGNLNLRLRNSNDFLELYDGSANLIDRVSWGEEVNSHPGVKRGQSIERSPAGQNSGEIEKDFITSDPPTPGLGLFQPAKITDIRLDLDYLELYYSWSIEDSNFDRLEVYLSSNNNFELVKTYYSLPEKITIDQLDLATNYQVKIRIVKSFAFAEIGSLSEAVSFSTDYDFSDQIVINELYPNPNQDEEEFIELYNRADREINLKGWTIADKNKHYKIDSKITIGPKQYLLFYYHQTKITLNNSGDRISLIYPDGEVADQTSYKKANKGISWSRKGNDFLFTAKPTPGEKNIFLSADKDEQPVDLKLIKIKKALGLANGRQVKIKGILSLPPGKFGKQQLYLQDSSAGIQLYSFHGNWPKLKLGSQIIVVGELSSIRGEKRIKISSKDDIRLLANKAIKPIDLNWANPALASGKLIKTKARVSSSAGSTFYINQDNKEIRVYIKQSTNINKPKTRKDYLVEIVGILVKSDSGFTILPRFDSDIKVLDSIGSLDGSLVSSNTSKLDSNLKLGQMTLTKVESASTLTNPKDYRLDLTSQRQESNQVSYNLLGIVIFTIGMLGLLGFFVYQKLFYLVEI